MLYVIAYDISSDARRMKVYRLLQGYGSPKQRSVFEADLDERQYRRLRSQLARLVRWGEDNVRFYSLCEGCRRRVEYTGGPETEQQPDVLVLG